MSTRACPDWPDLMEVAPDLQFKHYTVGEAGLPVEVLTQLDYDSLSEIALCAALEDRVYNATHTEPKVAAVLRASGWREVNEDEEADAT